MSAEGIKHDAGKLRWSLLPGGAVQEIIRVLEFGAAKYGANNWQRVPDSRERYYNALMRHIDAWWQGESYDPESCIHHLAHAGCCLLFLIWLEDEQE